MAERGGLVVHVFLVRGTAVLLTRRVATGFGDGGYGPPGGHLEARESLFQAAVRECREEIGVHIRAADLRVIGVSHYDTDNGHGVDFFLSTTRWEDEPYPRRECDHLLWCEPSALPRGTLPFTVRALQRHLREGVWFDELGWDSDELAGPPASVVTGASQPDVAQGARTVRQYPSGPLPSIHAVVLCQGKILLVRRANEPSRGKWSLPGGVIELGETLADAVEREVREETGAVVQFRRVVDAYSNVVRDERHSVRFHYVVLYSLCTYTEGEIKASSDAADVAWVSRSEVEQLDMHDYLKALLRREDLISSG